MSDSIGIDINEIVKSAYNTVLEILQAATETIGTNCLWARATPVINSEDVVLQEYTLTLVGLECPQEIKAIVSNTDYNPGEYTIDLFNLNYVLPLELNITIQTWNATFGATTMPQKGDIVYVQIYNKLFEVLSSELIYSLAAMPTYYKIVLSKYAPSASRKETEEFRESVEELTTSLQELFGDIISEEVADNNVTVETSYNNTTYVDPVKDFDFDSIVVNALYGTDGNLISNAYYDFSLTETNIKYHTNLIYETSAERNHLIYSLWCKTDNTSLTDAKIKVLKFYSKDSNYWYFRISTPLKLNEGDEVTITRGNLLKVNAKVVLLDNCVNTLGIAIKSSDMAKANRKLTRWYDTASVLKIYKTNITNILNGYDSNDKLILHINYVNNEIQILINGKSKNIPVNIDLSDWHYFMFDISPTKIRLVIECVKLNELNKLVNVNKEDSITKISVSDFNIDYFTIENAQQNVCMCNIRMYENEYEMGDLYKLDMYSPITKNASKLIFVDSPNIPNKGIFVSPVK